MTLPVTKAIHTHFLKHPMMVTNADGHLKWIAYSIPFIANILGVRTQSNWKKQVLLTIAAETIRRVTVDGLKKAVGEHRPSPFMGHHSFPSGHTACSFAGAELMRRELGDRFPVLGCAGYIGATATAVIRLGKNRHWLNDVICGAVIGVAAASLSYLVINKMERTIQKKKHARGSINRLTKNLPSEET
jgi:membrane-associated phospholipid phosphatase